MKEQKPIQPEGIAARVIDGHAVLVSPRTSKLYWLNPVATRIWELSTGEHTVAEISSHLCEEYAVEAERALADVVDMVREFREAEMLELDG